MTTIDAGLLTAPSREPRFSSARLLEVILRGREIAIFLLILVVFGATTIYNHSFASAASIQQLFAGAAIIALLSVGETLVIITRNVDLSVGSVLGLSAYLVGDLFAHNPGISIAFGILLGIGVGLVCGVVNGVIVAIAKVPSLVVTLGMLYLIRGVDALVVNGTQINPTSIPTSFIALGSNAVLDVPVVFIIAAGAVLIAWYAMRSFRASRDLYAIGSNPDAATLAGVPVRRRVFSTFVISGAIAGLAGALWLSQFATVESTAGSGYELNVVAAVVVGGVAIVGGSGTVLGAALGAILLNTINQALVAARISAFWNQGVAGALLLAAIAFDRYLSIRREHALKTKAIAHVLD